MKKRLKALLSSVLALLLVTSTFLPVVSATDITSEEYKFFNLLSNVNSSLTSAISTGTSTGNWSSAKNELLKYYTNKFTEMDWIKCNSGADSSGTLAKHDTLAFSEPYVGQTTVTTTANWYEISISPSNLTNSYVLSCPQSSENAGVFIASKEYDGTNCAPRLVIEYTDGTSATVIVSKDTFVRPNGYGTSETYATRTWGTTNPNELWASHKSDAANQLPYTGNDMRTYLFFDIPQTSKTVRSAKLRFNSRVKNLVNGGTPSDSSLPLLMFASYYKTWEEKTLTWSILESSNSIGHYSWNGLGGIVWSEEKYGVGYAKLHVPSEFINATSRFIEETSLCQTGDYTLAKNMLLRFAEQTYTVVQNGNGFPYKREIEAANRSLELPYIYRTLLMNNAFTAEENYQFLRWYYQDIQYIYKEKSGKLYIDGAGEPNTTLMWYTMNHGAWHVCGLYNCYAFFKEFKEAPSWRNVFDMRLKTTTDGLINKDGSYMEITLGYPTSVISWFINMLSIMDSLGDNSETVQAFRQRLVDLSKYLMDCSYPGGILPRYGDGEGGDVINVLRRTVSSNPNNTSKAMQNILWYLSNGEEGTAPELYSEYDDAKVVTDRSGWSKDDFFMFMNGKSGGGHTHLDSLAVLMYGYNRELLTDTGTTTYDTSTESYKFQKQTTRSHNTVEVDATAQRAQNVLSSSYDYNEDNISLYSNKGASTVRSYTTANSSAKHLRNVTFVKALGGLMIVNDSLIPNDSKSHTYTQNWHSAVGSNLKTTEKIGNFSSSWAYTSFSNGANVMIAQATPYTEATGTIVSSTKTGYDEKSGSGTTTYAEFKETGSGKASFNTAILPYMGTSAGVMASKIWFDTDDNTASAMRIHLFQNSSLSGLADEAIYYNSFETSPTKRTIKRCDLTARSQYFTTDASNSLYFVPNDETSIPFMYISNGQKLDIENRSTEGSSTVIASVNTSNIVTDLSASYDKLTKTLKLESNDKNVLNGMTCVTVKYAMNGSTPFSTISLNGTTLASGVNYTVNGNTVFVGSSNLLFDFTNDAQAKERYKSAQYGSGKYNFDIEGWNSRLLPLSYATKDNGDLIDTLGVQDNYNCFDSSYVETKACLNYDISKAEVIQVKLRLDNCKFKSNGIVGALVANKYGTTDYDWKYATSVRVTSDSIQYIVVDIPITQEIRSLGNIIILRVLTNYLEPISTSSTSYISYDYIYVGTKKDAPSGISHTVNLKDSDGTSLDSFTVSYGKAYYNMTIPTKDRATFIGWFTSANGGTQVTKDSICTSTSDETLYAHWKYEPIELTYDNMFSFSQWSKAERSSVKYYYPNWIVSGKIPIDLYDGSFTINKDVASHDSARIDYGGDDSKYYKVAVEPNTEYTFSVDVRCNDVTPSTFARVYCHNYNGTTAVKSTSYDLNQTGTIMFNVTTPSNVNYLEFSFEVRTQGATGSWTFSNINLRENSAPYNEITGYKDACRFTTEDYKPTNLIEPKREGYTFDGWYLKGTNKRITADSVIENDAALYSKWTLDVFSLVDGYTVDKNNHFIYGFAPGLENIDEFIILKSSEFTFSYANLKKHVSTGTAIQVIHNGEVVEEYTIIIFGDVNGDGWYDGMDSVLVNCIANKMLGEDALTTAQMYASDCNHDGIIDEFDVEILQQAGLLLQSIDQTKSEEELLATSSEYVEYLNLIDQRWTQDELEQPQDKTPIISIIIDYITTIIFGLLYILKGFLPF